MTDLFQSGELPVVTKPRPRAVLMRRTDIVNLKEMIFRTGYSPKLLTEVGKEFGIVRQLRDKSPLEFSWPGWLMLQHGDHEAIELLREGHRDHPDLARYFREAGVPI